MKKIILSAVGLAFAMAASSAFATDDAKTSHVKAGEHHQGGHMFKENDTNNDGAISKDEWKAKGEKMFEEIDVNKDGKISQDEMKAHRQMKRAEWEKRKLEKPEAAPEKK